MHEDNSTTRLQRYWRSCKVPLLISAPVFVMCIVTNNWGGIFGIPLVAYLAWMDTP